MDIVNLVCQEEFPGGLVLSVGYDEFHQLAFLSEQYGNKVGSFVGDVRGKTCRICGRGWDLTPASFRDQVTDPHEHALLVHRKCLRGVMAYNDRQLFTNAMIKARVRFDGPHEVKNEYDASDRPWYEAQLLDFPGVRIRFGHRKRVDHVEVVGIKCGNIFKGHECSLYLGDETTNEGLPEGAYIHVWTGEQLNSCISRIVEVLRKENNLRSLERTGDKT